MVTLLIGRSVARRREFLLRRALGAGARRVLRPARVEGAVLAVGGGGAAGLLVAWASLAAFTAQVFTFLPRVAEMRLDLTTTVAATVLAFVVALMCASASAAGALRGHDAELVRGTTRSVTPPMQGLRAGLVAGQVAMAIVLLTGAGLLARSINTLLAEDGGFDPGPVLTARLMVDNARFPDIDQSALSERYARRFDRVVLRCCDVRVL